MGSLGCREEIVEGGRVWGSWDSSLGGSSRGGSPGIRLPVWQLGGCILSISYVISVSMQCFVLDVIIKVGSCKVSAVLDWRSMLAHSQLWLFCSLSEKR